MSFLIWSAFGNNSPNILRDVIKKTDFRDCPGRWGMNEYLVDGKQTNRPTMDNAILFKVHFENEIIKQIWFFLRKRKMHYLQKWSVFDFLCYKKYPEWKLLNIPAPLLWWILRLQRVQTILRVKAMLFASLRICEKDCTVPSDNYILMSSWTMLLQLLWLFMSYNLNYGVNTPRCNRL